MNASQQQDAVKSYWEARGYSVKTEIVDTGVRLSFRDKATLQVVRSNLRNGLPPDYRVVSLCPKCASLAKQGYSIRCAQCDAQVPVRANAINEGNT